jgi:hypothetical protein
VKAVFSFYIRTALNLWIGILSAVGLWLASRTILWAFGKLPYVLIPERIFGALAGTAIVALIGSAVWTGAQWIQGRSFSN